MVRIAGIDLLDNKRIDYALTRIFGIGWSNAEKILKTCGIEPGKRVSTLNEDEVNKIQKVVDQLTVEGDLRRQEQENIKRLKDIGSYRGFRHSRNLPARGQRTRSNARTKRGKRVTIGAIKKEMAGKTGGAGTSDTAPEAKGKK